MTNEEAIKYLRTWNPYHPLKQEAITKAIRALMAQPRNGEWIIDEYGIHHCPFCKAINETVYQNFCPGCGADMRKDGEH